MNSLKLLWPLVQHVIFPTIGAILVVIVISCELYDKYLGGKNELK